jgi:deaminated glutathione amidase
MRPARVAARLPITLSARPLFLRRFGRMAAAAAAAAGGRAASASAGADEPPSPVAPVPASPSVAASRPLPAPAPPPLCRVAVAQMTSTADPEHNFGMCASLAEQAARGGARFLFLPECFAFIGERQQDALAFSQPLSGPLMARYRDLARRHRLWLSLGGFQERCPPLSADGAAAAAAAPSTKQEQPQPPQMVYNAHLIVEPTGEIAAVYRKIHLFDVDGLMESRTTRPGSGLVVVPACKDDGGGGGDGGGGDGGGGGGDGNDRGSGGGCPCGPLGLTTCYDIRFPEMWAVLAHDRGCRVIAVPSAFTKLTGEAHWELLLRARAVETQCYVVAAAQAGSHHAIQGGRESFGHAMVVDPWGHVVARVPEGPSATGLAFADLSAERVAQVRQRMPIARHRAAGRPGWASTA